MRDLDQEAKSDRKRHRFRIWAFHFFLLVLTAISFRHLGVEGDHLWTGEAARLSWSMRLKGKVCEYAVKVGDGEWSAPNVSLLSYWQRGNLDDPYFFQLFVKSTLCAPGARIYGQMNCRAISRAPSPLIHPDVDLCQAEYRFLTHNEWIYPLPGPWDPNYREWFETSNRVKAE